MALAVARRCQDCSTPLGLMLENQCISCQERTEWRWVRPPKGVVQAPGISPKPIPLPPPKPAKPRTCKEAGHRACEHFVMMGKAVVEAGEECGLCFICGGEWDDSKEELPHKSNCPLSVTLEPLASTDDEGA